MTDPRLDAAWDRFQQMVNHDQPHVVVQMLRDLFVPDEIIDVCVRRHETEMTTILELEEPRSVGRENAQNWYTGPRPDDQNWPAYKQLLARMLDDEAVAKIDDASDKIVAMLDHPATPKFQSRGLVVGHVQSGKTSNFTAVISKAADRGYRMFIVLSGIHNSLRRQTQTRLIRDVVQLNNTLWHQITKPEHDFVPPANAASLLTSKDQTLLLVVKKNAPVLRKLKRWLREAREYLANCPTVIIDDEADQATVATRTINPLIADIIDSLPKVCYVGYTATPFANLLIEPSDANDFYPKDFVVSLPRGDDYQGPEELFGRAPLDGEDPNDVPGGLDMIRRIPDDELPDLRPAKRSEVSGFAPVVTPSLRHACLWFWLATAARRARGQRNAHSSMLIHAHSTTSVHDSYKGPLEILRTSVSTGLADEESTVVSELRQLWDDECGRVEPPQGERMLQFAEVLPELAPIVDGTKIVMDHYRSSDRLDYSGEPSTVIAVGGNTLSRGLTLEGLVVSFFVRSADVYDTLLQMGRWFGYRPGYSDLPRIYMPDEMRKWFTHLATVEAELRTEIDRYLSEHKTPLELAVRIKCHPKMRVTAPSKQGSSIRASAAFGGQLVESRYYPVAPEEDARHWHEHNADAVRTLLEAANELGRYDERISEGRALWRGVPADAVQRFVGSYRFHDMSTDVSSDLMQAYIGRRLERGGLATWNVGIVGNKVTEPPGLVPLPNGRTVDPVSRARLQVSANDEVADIKTLTGSRDPALDLAIPQGFQSDRSNINGLRLKQEPETGLVLLYPIDSNSKGTKKGRSDLRAPGKYIWGSAFMFPQPTAGPDLAVEYDYVAADLSRVFPAAIDDDEQEDGSVLEQDMDSEAAGV